MTDRRHRLAGIEERLDEGDGALGGGWDGTEALGASQTKR
jgi:hypothetical protein